MTHPAPDSGPDQPEARQSRAYDLRARLVSAVILVPLALLCLVLGQAPYALLVAVAAVLVLREWVRMVNATQSVAAVAVGWVAVLVAMATIFFGQTGIAFGILAAGAICVAAIAPLHRVWAAAGVFYAGLPAVALVHLRGLEHGLWAVVFLLVVVWATDVAAYGGGRTIGGPKLWPSVSPKKTWAGFISGLAGAGLGGILIAWLAGPEARYGAGWGVIALLAVVISFAGQMGDLFESFMKRHYGVKDSGTLIPGHGGAMDRLDSVITAASVAALIAIAFGLPRVSEPFYWSSSQ
ncbi:MAG: phosphatidate cytidylyltransferase [Tepidamorphaceae bacterium]